MLNKTNKRHLILNHIFSILKDLRLLSLNLTSKINNNNSSSSVSTLITFHNTRLINSKLKPKKRQAAPFIYFPPTITSIKCRWNRNASGHWSSYAIIILVLLTLNINCNLWFNFSKESNKDYLLLYFLPSYKDWSPKTIYAFSYLPSNKIFLLVCRNFRFW